MAKYLDDTLNIIHKDRTLNYTLAGFTLKIGNPFTLIAHLNQIRYRYDDMLSPKLREWQKDTSLGKLNSILYVLTVDGIVTVISRMSLSHFLWKEAIQVWDTVSQLCRLRLKDMF